MKEPVAVFMTSGELGEAGHASVSCRVEPGGAVSLALNDEPTRFVSMVNLSETDILRVIDLLTRALCYKRDYVKYWLDHHEG